MGKRGSLERFAWLPLPVILAALAWIWSVGPDWGHEAPSLVLGLNLVVTLPVALVIATLAGRSFLWRNDPGLVWLGSGALLWGLSGLFGSFIVGHDANAGVTTHNMLAWLSAACHLVGVSVSARSSSTVRTGSAMPVWVAYAAAIVTALAIAHMAQMGQLPRFFVPGQGGTPVRQTVLLSAMLMFFAAATLLFQRRPSLPTPLPYWYGLAMLLIAIGLLAILLQSSTGSAVGWVGRVAQLLGSTYMLVAVVMAARAAARRGDPAAIALSEAEQRFDDLIDMSGDGIVVHELAEDGQRLRFVHANPAILSLLGYRADDMSAIRPADIMAPEDFSRMATEMRLLLPVTKIKREMNLVARDGRRVPVEISHRLFRRGGREVVVSVIHDISERLLLEHQRAQLAAIVESSQDAVIGETPEGVVTSWNRAAESIFGYSAGEALGKSIAMLYPQDGVGKTEWADPARGQPVNDVDTSLRRKDGRLVAASVSVFPILDQAGCVVGVARVVRDITERKKAELAEYEASESLRLELEHQVAERTAALTSANRELEAFTYAASHDLKAPLGRINSFSSLLETHYRDRLDGNGLMYLDYIRSNATRMIALIDDMLAHARIERQQTRIQAIDPGSVVRAVLDERQVEIAEIGAEVRVDLPDLKVAADAVAFSQVLRNLLENALKYSAKAVQPRIDIGGEGRGDHCRLWVRDNGIGFDMAYHDAIFEMFRRLNTYDEFPGTGVGLALVRKAMEKMDGSVWAESRPGEGATFFLELPLHAETKESAPA